MKEEAEGVVIALEGDVAKVRTSRHSDCDDCGMCPGDSAAILDVRNTLDAKVGQRVVIQLPESHMLKAAFVVYLLPLLATFAGFLLGMWIAQKFALPVLLLEVGVAAVAFVLTLLYIRSYDRFMARTKTMPMITRTLPSAFDDVAADKMQ